MFWQIKNCGMLSNNWFRCFCLVQRKFIFFVQNETYQAAVVGQVETLEWSLSTYLLLGVDEVGWGVCSGLMCGEQVQTKSGSHLCSGRGHRSRSSAKVTKGHRMQNTLWGHNWMVTLLEHYRWNKVDFLG